ncbi:HNH endonuclease [Amycolatopsis thermoflava]|uniref:HNH endonuclease n=1 Tax=Amycolatopsis thermoflava TaxID=84480 RepID=UPI00380E96E3
MAKHQGRSGRPWARVKQQLKALFPLGPCWICGHLIPPDVPPNHPLEYTADHVVPRSKGGRPTLENSRPAHRRCNSQRGANTAFEPPVQTSRAW